MNDTPWVVRLTLDSSTKETIKLLAKENRRSAGAYLSVVIEHLYSGGKEVQREQVP